MEREDLIICRCQEVLRSELEEAVGLGCCDWRGLKRRTGVGLGPCQGRVCRPLVEARFGLGREEAGSQCLNDSLRPPARPIRLGDLEEDR